MNDDVNKKQDYLLHKSPEIPINRSTSVSGNCSKARAEKSKEGALGAQILPPISTRQIQLFYPEGGGKIILYKNRIRKKSGLENTRHKKGRKWCHGQKIK